jgi:hypothetical protein
VTTSFTRRIVLAFAVLLLGFGLLVAFLGHRVTLQHEQETLQRLSHGLAKHIVDHWPQVARPADGAIDRTSLDDVLHMLMVVNPGIEVYVLDSAAQVRSYLGEPGAVREPRVDMGAMNAFLSGAPLPLLGSDPKAPGAPKIFSVAPFPGTADGSTPGYLYVVLNGEARTRVAAGIGTNRVWQTTLLVGVAGLLVTLSIGLMTFHTLTRPLRRVAGRMRTFGLDEMEGDLQLIDRALTNLIDNAVRHGPGTRPVRVSLLRRGRGATVLVEDSGPGLPVELVRRLDQGQPVREPPPERPGGGFGGLGLAIAQRIAWLHGGSLRTLPAPRGGTRLCLALPLVAKRRA